MGMHQSQEPRYREVLGEDADRLVVNGPRADDHSIAMQNLVLHAKITRRMLHKKIILMKGIFVEDRHDPGTRSELPHLRLLFHGLIPAPFLDLLLALPQVQNVAFQ